MLDGELLADREVEFVLVDQGFAQVGREFGIASHLWQRPRAEALVGDGIALGRADGEGGVLVEHEIGAVVVVHHDRDIGLEAREPLAHRDVGVGERLPRRRLHPAAVVGDADRGDVRKTQTGDDPRRHP